MTRQLAVELRRLAARRLVWLLVGTGFLGVLAAGPIIFLRTERVDQAAITVEAERLRESFVRMCLAGEFPEGFMLPGGRSATNGELRQHCERSASKIVFHDPSFSLAKFPSILRNTTILWVLLSFTIGATFVGAEWRAGTVVTALTWEPRRVRVALAKVLAALIGGVTLVAAFQVLVAATLAPTAAVKGSTMGAGAAIREMIDVIVRGGLLAGMVAAIGSSLAHIGRNSAAALGAGFVYLAIMESGLVGGVFPGISRWLIVGNAIVFMGGENVEIAGRSVAAAGALLALYAVGTIGVAATVFRARDIS